jgi:DNA-binding SARP family transcriptional activator
VRVCLLGPIRISVAGHDVRLTGGLQHALLVALASEAGRIVSTNSLIEAMWGDHPPNSANVKVQGIVSSLRKALVRTGLCGADDRWPLHTCDPGYAFSAEGVTVDLLQYRVLLGQATDELAAGQLMLASDLLSEALALWSGPAIAGLRLRTPILCAMADALEGNRLLTIERKARCDLQLGRYEMVADQLSGFVAANPLREGMRAALMLALFRCGCCADALEYYRKGRQLLREQLGIEPSPPLRRLHELMLSGATEFDMLACLIDAVQPVVAM